MTCFSDIIGQERVVERLRAELRGSRLYHAYLLEGAPGTGRYTLARALAASALCGDATGEPARNAVHLFAAGNHPDYLELSREATELGVGYFTPTSRPTKGGADEARQEPVLVFISRKPLMAPRSVVLIPDAQRMNLVAANSFLKTLEEPPADALIILTVSERHRLLPTIISRCRLLQLAPLPVEMVARELVRRGLAGEEQARDLALVAEGSLGRALDLAAGPAAEHWHWLQESFQRITPAGAMELARGLLERAKAGGGLGRERRALATRLLDMAALLVRRRLRAGESPRRGWRALRVLWEAAEQLAANVNYDLVMHEAAIDTFAALKQG